MSRICSAHGTGTAAEQRETPVVAHLGARGPLTLGGR